MHQNASSNIFACLLVGAASACGGGGDSTSSQGAANNATTATLKITLEPEGHILTGLFPGMLIDDIRDGWTVTFSKVVATIGNVRVTEANGTTVSSAGDAFVVDVAHPSASPGVALWNLSGIGSGSFDFVFQAHSAADATRHNSVQQAEFTEMRASDWTYLIEGSLKQTGAGRSCPPASLAMPPAGASVIGMNAAGDRCYANATIAFRIGVNSESKLGACGSSPPQRSLTIAAGAATEASITIHADHLFTNGFAAQPVLAAQWLADADLNLDGNVTNAELARIAPRDLSALSGLNFTPPYATPPIMNMVDYLGAIARMLPQFNGDLKCTVTAP